MDRASNIRWLQRQRFYRIYIDVLTAVQVAFLLTLAATRALIW